MPTKAPRPCAEPGCPNLVTKDGVYRCEDHYRPYMNQWKKPRDVDYGKGWALKSKMFLRAHPDCERCGEKAVLAHHIIRKRDGGSDDDDNLEALCNACHEAEHVNERWGKRGSG